AQPTAVEHNWRWRARRYASIASRPAALLPFLRILLDVVSECVSIILTHKLIQPCCGIGRAAHATLLRPIVGIAPSAFRKLSWTPSLVAPTSLSNATTLRCSLPKSVRIACMLERESFARLYLMKAASVPDGPTSM